MIREPAVSGTFYPDDAKVLTREIQQYLKEADPEEIHGDIKGLISPHAGYMYSGPVAAWGYKVLSGRTYDTVIVIAPSHKSYFEGAAIIEQGGYRTPLGVVPVDEEFAAALLKKDSVVRSDVRPHQGEHALEVQLPFLQSVLKDFRMVPLIMGAHGIDLCEQLASGLVQVMKGKKQRFLVVGSTDLSHYYPYRHAVDLDGRLVSRLNNFDVEGLVQDLATERCEACGVGPIITTMRASRGLGANVSKVLKYANSGDVSGDKSAVVGYTSCVFYKAGNGRDG